MTTTYSTDDDCYDACALAHPAMEAYSVARVDQSRSAVTDLDVQRVEAKRLITARLRQRGILSGDIDRSSDLKRVEVCLTLVLLFEAVGQHDPSGQADVYAQQAKLWRERYEAEFAVAAPVDGVRATGASFEWGRG
jgi:hypothetical protein